MSWQNSRLQLLLSTVVLAKMVSSLIDSAHDTIILQTAAISNLLIKENKTVLLVMT